MKLEVGPSGELKDERAGLMENDPHVAAKSMRLSKLFYKGSTIEITSRENGPDEWNVSFDIPPSILHPNGMGRIMRGGFRTRADALRWTREEIDSFRK